MRLLRTCVRHHSCTVRVSPIQRFTSRTRSSARMATDGHGELTLVSFDVDGTLIESIGTQANKLHKDAFSHGLKVVFDIDTNIDVVKHHGSTDPLIVIKVMEHHGYPKDQVMAKLPEVEAAMIDYFVKNAEHAAEGIAVLPGVVELLNRLKNHGKVATCLVTGNLEPIGWSKMKALGILDLFSEPRFGGFSTDFCSGNTEESWKDRAEFVRIAAGKCSESYPAAADHVGIVGQYGYQMRALVSMVAAHNPQRRVFAQYCLTTDAVWCAGGFKARIHVAPITILMNQPARTKELLRATLKFF